MVLENGDIDLKPSNILINNEGDSNYNLAYNAPAIDIWSLGVIYFEMLTNRYLFPVSNEF